MPTSLPYLASGGSITNALEKIRSAATPERFTTDFVTTKLMIKGGTGTAIPPFLKKIGLVASDGTPTELYKSFRNTSTGGQAIAEAIKIGYHPLIEANEYFYELPDKDLLALIVQITGLDANNQIVKKTLTTINNLKAFADFENNEDYQHKEPSNGESVNLGVHLENEINSKSDKLTGLNLTYTINLNLPPSTDQAVFNAIFRSLKEHLLSHEQ